MNDLISKFIESYDATAKDSSDAALRCKVKHRCLKENGAPIKIVCNYGLMPGDVAHVKRDGIYHNFTIEALERIYPIVTEDRILDVLKKILRSLKKSNNVENKVSVQGCQTIGVQHIVMDTGISHEQALFYAIDVWQHHNKFPKLFESAYDIKTYDTVAKKLIENHVRRERHQPLSGKFRVINCGCNSKTKEPVVPIEWIGRTFANGKELHAEMDKLESRKGEPPTMFCAIFSMPLVEQKLWIGKKDVTDEYVYVLESADNTVTSRRIPTKKTSKTFRFVQIDDFYIGIELGTDSSAFTNNLKRQSYAKTNKLGCGSVGYMSSLLQKLFRRGSFENHQQMMRKTLYRLNSSTPYNLPDHNFIQVSGTRQLLWRSYVSIVEDGVGYQTDSNSEYLDMTTLILMALVANADPSLSLTSDALDCMIRTLNVLQAHPDLWDWRAYSDTLSVRDDAKDGAEDGAEDNTEGDADRNQISDSLLIAIKYMPMMTNDRTMMSRAYNYTIDNNFEYIDKLHSSVVIDVPKHIAPTVRGACHAAQDMHCSPTMLITLQASLDLDLTQPYVPELERLASFIWTNSSRYNYRYTKSDQSRIIGLYDDKEIKKLCNGKYAEHKKYVTKISEECLDRLHAIQRYSLRGRYRDFVYWIDTKYCFVESSNEPLEKRAGRIAWLLLFGKSRSFRYKNRVYQITLSGTADSPCKIKRHNQKSSEYVTGDLRSEIEIEYLKQFGNVTISRVPDLPDGYAWKTDLTSRAKHVLSYDTDTASFRINDNLVKTLDLSDLIQRTHKLIEYTDIPKELDALIRRAMYVCQTSITSKTDSIIFELQDVAYFRRLFADRRVWDWSHAIDTNDNVELRNLIRIVLSRIHTTDIDDNGKHSIKTGPCDRRGKKTQNSISYAWEGSIHRVLTLLEALYPTVMIRRTKDENVFEKSDGSATGKWYIDHGIPEYTHMMRSLESMINVTISKGNDTKNSDHISKSVDRTDCTDVSRHKTSKTPSEKSDRTLLKTHQISCTTDLWEHQSKTVNKIYDGMIEYGVRGFGDASHVGAGKTLCALSLMSKLYHYKVLMKSDFKSSAFLVMVPNIVLIDTWVTEAKKHFPKSGFDILVQQANGTLKRNDDNDGADIKPHTLVVSTMGRVREHPFRHPWILVVIDECLSVQNKEALQTEEAWRQSCHSEYGIVMLSATFFRSRFDKMLYMLKMLRSGLPESKEYLDAILSEHIVSNITESDRIWTVSTDRHKLSNTDRKTYDAIYDRYVTKGSELLYTKLSTFIHEKIDYVKIFTDTIDALQKQNKRCVIFAKSKNEAEAIASSSKMIGMYPEKLKHCVVSLSQGTYGLNDLVIYDTIIMRPPEPDKLPQIKGRLDRPGQKSKDLTIRYVLLEGTIEEAGITRLELCNKFYSNYLMPLAEFYDMAVSLAPKGQDAETKIKAKTIKTAKTVKTAKRVKTVKL